MFHILFVCTHNRCRSILCEAITSTNAQGVLRVSSAGSHPAGVIYPETLNQLRQRGYSVENLESTSWADLEQDAPDLVVTVCDSAAGEACPLWLSAAQKVHWPLLDPSKLSDTEHAAAAFNQVMAKIEAQVPAWLAMARKR